MVFTIINKQDFFNTGIKDQSHELLVKSMIAVLTCLRIMISMLYF
jgi:hypothetical protein